MISYLYADSLPAANIGIALLLDLTVSFSFALL